MTLQIVMSSCHRNGEVADNIKSRGGIALAPPSQPSVENEQISAPQTCQSLFRAGGISIGECREFRIKVQERVRHLRLEPLWKVLDQFSTMPAQSAPVSAP